MQQLFAICIVTRRINREFTGKMTQKKSVKRKQIRHGNKTKNREEKLRNRKKRWRGERGKKKRKGKMMSQKREEKEEE